MNDANKTIARKLAGALFASPASPKTPSCPLCEGQTFRFKGANRIQCMLCSNQGTITMDTGVPMFTISQGEHPMFLTKAEVLKHKQWLIGMKSRFMDNKDQLKKITIDYLNDGQWPKP